MQLTSLKKVKELSERREIAIEVRKKAALSSVALSPYEVATLPRDLVNGMFTELLTNEIVAIEAELKKLGVSVARGEPEIVDTAENWKGQAGMYARAWLRELGDFVGRNHHQIDALVTGTAELVREARVNRRRAAIPAKFVEWGVATFGGCASDPRERALRFVEEALEVGQMFGIEREAADAMIRRVYGREAGTDKRKEIGQAQATLSMLAHQVGVDAAEAMEIEFDRVRAIPKEEWAKRHAPKVEAGLAT